MILSILYLFFCMVFFSHNNIVHFTMNHSHSIMKNVHHEDDAHFKEEQMHIEMTMMTTERRKKHGNANDADEDHNNCSNNESLEK